MNRLKWAASLALAIFIAVISSPVQAQVGPPPGVRGSLVERVAALEALVATLQAQVAALQTALDNEITARQAADAGLQTTLNNEITARQAADAGLQTALVPGLRDYLMVDTATDTVLFSGANVQIVNGEGATNIVNGLGNLILGYDEQITPDAGTPICSLGDFTTQEACETAGHVWSLNHKNGSHYLVVGPFHNYSQSGGIVAGLQNSSNNHNATVIGGSLNTASGEASVVSGGIRNVSSGIWSSVSGGMHNTASGGLSSVWDGIGKVAAGGWSSDNGLNVVLNSAIEYVIQLAQRLRQGEIHREKRKCWWTSSRSYGLSRMLWPRRTEEH